MDTFFLLFLIAHVVWNLCSRTKGFMDERLVYGNTDVNSGSERQCANEIV